MNFLLLLLIFVFFYSDGPELSYEARERFHLANEEADLQHRWSLQFDLPAEAENTKFNRSPFRALLESSYGRRAVPAQLNAT